MDYAGVEVRGDAQVRNMGDGQVKDLVSRYLEPHQPRDFRLNVVGLRRDDEWFYVVVQPDRDDIRSYDYYAILAEVENELEEQERVNILLVPVLPGE